MLRLRREVTGACPTRSRSSTRARHARGAPRRPGVVVNCGRGARLPAAAGELLLSSGDDPVDGRLAPDTAAWFRVA